MSSNENNTRVDDAISKLLRDGRGHSALGKRMNLPMPEEIGLPLRPRHDPPPGYGKTEGLSAPPDYKGKASVTAEKKAPSPVAEKAAVTATPPKVAPLYLPTKKIKPHPVHAAYQKMMAGFEEKVKTEQEVEQGTKLSDYTIAHRADALFIAKNLKLRYFHECSEAHFNEFQRLVGEEGMSIDEACAAHSDFGAWMASEKIERQRDLSPEEAEADVERIMARLRL